MSSDMKCPGCDGQGSYYGMAPHHHDLTSGTFIGSTRVEPRSRWPKNFHEDPECPGLGVWNCATCDGAGVVETPWEPTDDASEENDTDSVEHHVEYVDTDVLGVLGLPVGDDQ